MSLYRSDVRLSIDPPFLPSAVEFVAEPDRAQGYLDGAYFRREHRTRVEQLAVRRRIASTQSGLAGGEYRVLRHTNFNGNRLPLAFELTVFRHGRAQVDRGDRRVAATYTGRAIAFEEAALDSGLPLLPSKPVWVGDLRFRHATRRVDGINYYVTNRWITDVNDPGLARVYRAKVAAASGLGAIDWRRAAILSLIAGVTLVPVTWWMVTRKARPLIS